MGVELVQVDGTVAANQFQLTGPVFQGGYEYTLNYVANFSGIHDGFFLQSHVRDELWGHAAMLTAGQAMLDACFRGEDRAGTVGDDRRGRAWATVNKQDGGGKNPGGSGRKKSAKS